MKRDREFEAIFVVQTRHHVHINGALRSKKKMFFFHKLKCIDFWQSIARQMCACGLFKIHENEGIFYRNFHLKTNQT